MRLSAFHRSEYNSTFFEKKSCKMHFGAIECHSNEIARNPMAPRRKLPPWHIREDILNSQRKCCFYCGFPLEDWFLWNGKPIFTKTQWDHLLPFSYSCSNNNDNFVAACQVCNGLKSSKVFETINELVTYVRQKRSERDLPLRKVWHKFYQTTPMAEVLLKKVPELLLLESPCDYSNLSDQSIEKGLAELKQFRRSLNNLQRAKIKKGRGGIG